MGSLALTPSPPRRLAPPIRFLDSSIVILRDVCCNGSPLAGGGHGDIFKDEVLRVVWEETTARPVTGHDVDRTGSSSRS